jgi:hypothetical protein
MTNVGTYLYGFALGGFRPAADLRGLAGAPLGVVSLGEVSAVVSRHPVMPLTPSRKNLEPHHRIVREISTQAALVPAAFGHICESEHQLLDVIRGNHQAIRDELTRLAHKCEMGLTLVWNVDNIFELMVRTSRDLRDLRDRIFSRRQPSVAEKLDVGALFEATLTRQRERLSAVVLDALHAVTCEVASVPPRDEKTVFQAALLIRRASEPEFLQLLQAAAKAFDSSYTLQTTGPWPPYSFVRLRLRLQAPEAGAARS